MGDIQNEANCVAAILQVPMENVVPAFRGLVSNAEALAKCGRMVRGEKSCTQFSEEWQQAYTDTAWMMLFILDLFRMFKQPEEQVTWAKRSVDKWQRACDLKLWEVVCADSHAVPLEKIAAMQAEVEKVRDFLNNKELH